MSSPRVFTIWWTSAQWRLTSVGEFGAPLLILTGFASWLRCCNDVVHRRPTKHCTMFDRLLSWYTTYTFSEAFACWRNFASCKLHFARKSCVLVYWQRYCTALQQRASAKLCGVVQGMELPNFPRGPGVTYIRLGGHHVGHRPIF